MKRLLRGVMDSGGISREGLVSNYKKLRDANIRWVQPTDRKLYKYVCDFFEAEGEVPASRVVVEFFSKIDDIETIERLKDIDAAMAYEGANYSHVIRTVIEDQRRMCFASIVKNAVEIASRGLIVGEGKEKRRLEGVDEARHWLASELHALELASQRGKTEADWSSAEEVQAALSEYERSKITIPTGVLTGLGPLDEVTRGLRPGQLWTHAAYTGGLKSTWALNWAVSATTSRRATNVLFFSFEMSVEEIRAAAYAMHAGDRGRHLSVTAIHTGRLDDEEEQFYRATLRDLSTSEFYGHVLVRCPSKETRIKDIAEECRRLSGDYEIGMVIIDHSGLVATDRRERDPVERYSATFRDAKRLARDAFDGQGVGVLMLHQINREGAKRVTQGGQFALHDMGMTIESARSSDVVTTSWQDDELRNRGQARFQILKNRAEKLIEPFLVEVHPDSRRMFYADASNRSPDDRTVEDILAMV